MKIGWFLSPFFVMMSRLGSMATVSATGGIRGLDEFFDDDDTVLPTTPTDDALVTDTASLYNAVANASGDRANPTTIWIDPDAEIDFDDGFLAGVDDEFAEIRGINVVGKYINYICDGYDEIKKCTLKRSMGGGGFFWSRGGTVGAHDFIGIEFIGGMAIEDHTKVTDGGAVNALHSSSGDCVLAFTDCAFINNTVKYSGGAIHLRSPYPDASLSVTRCVFDGNVAGSTPDGFGGGAIYASANAENREPEDGYELKLSITQSIFENNFAGGLPGNDIMGSKSENCNFTFSCSETITSGTDDDVSVPAFQGVPQTCSVTALPTSTPTTSPTASPTNEPTASPTSPLTNAPTALPTSAPTTSPTALPTSAPTRGWQEITFDDFESGWGNFTGNSEAELVDGGAACLEKKGIKSSIFHTNNHDVTAYANLRVELSFYFTNMDDHERFFLEYSSDGGNSWEVMKRFIRGRPFDNGVTYTRSVDFDVSGKSYELTDEAKIRFRSKANAAGELSCIDDVKFEGLPN